TPSFPMARLTDHLPELRKLHEPPPRGAGAPRPGESQAETAVTAVTPAAWPPPAGSTRRRYQQERRTIALESPLGMGGDLGLARSPFVQPAHRETDLEQQIDVARDRAVLLDHAFGQPVGRARAFVEIAIERPCLSAAVVLQPVRPAGRRVE